MSVLFPATAIGYMMDIERGLNKLCIQPRTFLEQMENIMAKIKTNILAKTHEILATEIGKSSQVP